MVDSGGELDLKYVRKRDTKKKARVGMARTIYYSNRGIDQVWKQWGADLWGRVGVAVRDNNVKMEQTALVGGSGGSENRGLPMVEVVVDRASSDTWGGVVVVGLELLLQTIRSARHSASSEKKS